MADMTVLAVLTLPGVARSAPYARRFLHDTLVPGHLGPRDELLDDLVLVVDEFVGNGIRHTASGRGGKVTISLLRGQGLLRAEVTDDGADGARPVMREHPQGESGRGLHIVEAVATRWGHRPDGACTTVWAEFAVDAATSRPEPAGSS